ncbi:MAG: hypothetical protein V2A34_04180 [Lentisphaerota bacterium]
MGADETSGYRAWRNVWFGDLADYTHNPESFIYSQPGDYDVDGCNNLAEFLGNSNPRNPTSYFALTGFSLTNTAQAALSFPARTHRIFVQVGTPFPSASPASWPLTHPPFQVPSNHPVYVAPTPFTAACFFHAVGITE